MGRWARLLALVGVSLGLAFGIGLLINSQAMVGNTNERNRHSLEVVANVLETWPRDLALVAELNYPEQNPYKIDHPDLGHLEIDYPPCPKVEGKPEGSLFPAGKRAEDGAQVALSGAFPSDSTHCYSTTVSLARLIELPRSSSDFSHLLILAPDGTLVEQFGTPRLPMTKLDKFSPVSDFARDVAGAIEKKDYSAGEKTQVPLNSSPGETRVDIGGTDYLAYVRPVRFARSGRNCPEQASPAKPAPATTVAVLLTVPPVASAKSTPVAASDTCQLYVVGLMPATALRHAWLKPSPLLLVGFGLALVILLALLPVGRLVMIGGTECLSGHEVAGLVFGLFAATSLATLAFLFAVEVTGERDLARSEAQTNASLMAKRAGQELNLVLLTATRCVPESPKTKTSIPNSKIIDAAFFADDGKFSRKAYLCGTKTLPNKTEIGFRPYFKALHQATGQSFEQRRYSIGQVRAQTDGIDKTILAIDLEPDVLKRDAFGMAHDRPPWPNDAKAPESPSEVLVVSTLIREFVAPLLPSPQKYMVVDTSDDRLPVLFHHDRARAGVEDFASQIKAPLELVQALRTFVVGRPVGNDPFSFARRYDGHIAHFSAAAIPHTPWVVLVYHSVDDVDGIAAWTTARAFSSWASVTVVAVLICVILLLWRKEAWRCLWPFRAGQPIYVQHSLVMAGLAVSIVGLALIRSFAAVLTAILLGSAICVTSYLRLKSTRLTAAPLTQKTERAYRYFVFAALACVAVAPMVAFWTDARILSRHRADAQRIEGAADGVVRRFERSGNLLHALHIEPGPDRDVFNPWSIDSTRVGIWKSHHPMGFGEQVLRIQSDIPLGDVHHCDFKPAPTGWYCWRNDLRDQPVVKRIGIVTPHPEAWKSWSEKPWSKTSWSTVIALFLLGTALAALIRAAVYYGLWSLTGFGIPLGAVTWPTLLLGGGKLDPKRYELRLARKSLLVAPQQAVRNDVGNPNIAATVDLANKTLPALNQAVLGSGTPTSVPSRLVVTGLDLVLRDGPRRRAALDYLENAAALVEAGNRQLQSLVVIAEMSPLERILDAFDTVADDLADRSTAREELRWARLFEDFMTFSFAPIDKIRTAIVDGRVPDRSSPVRTLIDELRWLPGNVIDSLIASEKSAGRLVAKDQRYPRQARAYQAHYTPRIIRWAIVVNPVTDEAAIDYLRSNLIEHYQQCWAASSFAERFTLDAIARGCYLNMRKTLALQSLVRRGLVILDPSPRLMNRSFAMFIRQTERPDTLQAWRDKQPRSAWSFARLPLTIILPLSVIGLAVGAAESGQEFTAIFSLLIAGTPALIGAVMRSVRGTSP